MAEDGKTYQHHTQWEEDTVFPHIQVKVLKQMWEDETFDH
jgi:hypothetical protein